MTMLNVAIAEDNPKTMEVLNEMLEKESWTYSFSSEGQDVLYRLV